MADEKHPDDDVQHVIQQALDKLVTTLPDMPAPSLTTASVNETHQSTAPKTRPYVTGFKNGRPITSEEPPNEQTESRFTGSSPALHVCGENIASSSGTGCEEELTTKLTEALKKKDYEDAEETASDVSALLTPELQNSASVWLGHALYKLQEALIIALTDNEWTPVITANPNQETVLDITPKNEFSYDITLKQNYYLNLVEQWGVGAPSTISPLAKDFPIQTTQYFKLTATKKSNGQLDFSLAVDKEKQLRIDYSFKEQHSAAHKSSLISVVDTSYFKS
jgi:hypothetical protein